MAEGQVLKEPEALWNRFDNTNNLITYSNEWSLSSDSNYYKGTKAGSNKKGAKISFSFNGTRIRLIGANISNGTSFTVEVDGVTYTRSTLKVPSVYQVVIFELSNLSDGTHNVVIEKNSSDSGWLMFDAIDIYKGYISLYALRDFYLFSKSNTAYTIENGALKSLGTITTANASTLFKSGVEAITKEHCVLVGQQLGKAKIMRMLV